MGPGTPAGRYLRLFWQPVMRAKDLPVGKAKPLEILGETFTIYRGEDGAPHVTALRCPHRGTQLSLGWVEGIELNFFGAVLGIDLRRPAIKLPGLGRIGLSAV